MKPIKPIYVLIIVLLVAAAGFYGGMTYQKSQRLSFSGGANGQFVGRRFMMGGTGNAQSMMPVRGEIISQSSDSITVKLPDGSSKIVNLTAQTKVNKMTSGAVSDLKSGVTVTAIGTTNSDGSVTAQDVSIGTFMMRGGPSRPSTSGQ